jgi:hypothetical protein
MKANVSIFNRDVSVPGAARDFSLIPEAYRRWFIDLYEHGRRTAPPAAGDTVQLAPAMTVISSTERLAVREAGEFAGEVLDVVNRYGLEFIIVAEADQTCVYEHGTRIWQGPGRGARLVFPAGSKNPVIAYAREGRMALDHYDLTERRISPAAPGAQYALGPSLSALSVESTLVLLQGNMLLALEAEELGGRIFLSAKKQWRVLPQATTLYDGVAVQDVLGVPYMMIPFSAGGEVSCMVCRIPELAALRVIDARHDGGICMTLCSRDGVYDRLIFKFAPDYQSYSCRREKDVATGELNFVTLDNGVAIHIPRDGRLEIFSRSPADDRVKIVQDPMITADMALLKAGVHVLCAKAGTLYRLTLN